MNNCTVRLIVSINAPCVRAVMLLLVRNENRVTGMHCYKNGCDNGFTKNLEVRVDHLGWEM